MASIIIVPLAKGWTGENRVFYDVNISVDLSGFNRDLSGDLICTVSGTAGKAAVALVVVQLLTSAGALGIFIAVFFIGVVLRLLVRPFIGGAWRDRQDHSDGGA